MFKLCLVVVVSLLCSAASAVPVVPETFQTQFAIVIESCLSSSGPCTASRMKGRTYEDMAIPAISTVYTGNDTAHILEYDLSRFDLGKEFIVDMSTRKCQVRPIPKTFAGFFGFLQFATAAGTAVVNGVTCSVFKYKNVSACLDSQNTPLQFTTEQATTGTGYERTTIIYSSFAATKPDPSNFKILPVCPQEQQHLDSVGMQ